MNRSSRSADQLFLVLLTEQGRGVSCCPDSFTNMDYRVRAALDQSGLPAFFPLSGKLAHQVMSARAYKLERAPARTNDSPTTDAVRAHLHAGLACFIGVSLHRHLSSRVYLNKAFRTPSGLLSPLRYVQEGEPLLSSTCVLVYLTLSRLSNF